MAFTGKCTYTAGTTIPEVAEDVSDLVSILSPHETPLLDALGDPLHAATSTRHEWLDDELLPNFDVIAQPGLNDTALNTTSLTVANGSRFRIGDQIQGDAKHEVIFVTGVTGNTLTLVRGYGGSTKHALTDALKLRILGNAALEGSDADAARFTIRTRRSNYTQIFSAAVQVSGTEAAVRQLAVDDEIVLPDDEQRLHVNCCETWRTRRSTGWRRRAVRKVPRRCGARCRGLSRTL